MEKLYELSGYQLLVVFNKGIVTIKDADTLAQYLAGAIEARSQTLVNIIKHDYLLLFGEALKISLNSLIIEIWGHVIVTFYANALKKRMQSTFFQKFAEATLKRSSSIDCGEFGKDHNRIIWNILASFKPLISAFIPRVNLKKSINEGNLSG